MTGIYMIENLVTGRVYVGSTNNASKRFKNHVWRLNNNLHFNRYLQRSWNKYGEKCFKFKVIEECENLVEREQYWVDYYKLYGKIYNQKVECVNSFQGMKRDKSWNKKISLSNLGRKVSDEGKERMSLAKKGHIPWNKGLTKDSDDRVLKHSLKLKEQVIPKEQREKISKSLKNYYEKVVEWE